MQSNRRASPRYTFFAAAELTVLATGARTETRTSDLGANGCFLDTPNPLPAGAIINIQIIHEGQVFKAGGVVAHSHPNIGMGVKFIALESGCADLLESWLHAAALV
jgi:hypothetical protein